VDGRPLDHEAEGSRWQMAMKCRKRIDVHLGHVA
jgi:hypothetical protein